ncbi:glycosyltransferase [Vibrio cyclitrophicus]
MLYINFPDSGGVYQLSSDIEKKAENKLRFYWTEPGFFRKFKILKYANEKEVWFSNNNFAIYIFLMLSFSRCNIILHDHKVRDFTNIKEVLLNFLFTTFRWRFNKIIVHQKFDKESKRLLKHSNVYFFKMPPHGFPTESENVLKKCFNKNHIKILCFGRIENYKNFEYFSNIIKQLDNVELTIAGSGVLPLSFGDLNTDKVKIINKYIDNELLNTLLEETDFFALPYKTITQSTLPALSGRYRCPIIYSDIEGLSQLDSFKLGVKIDGDNFNKDLLLLKDFLGEIEESDFERLSANSNLYYNLELESWLDYVRFICEK